MEREHLRLSPELRTPPTGAGQRTSGWGQAIEHGPGTTLYVINLASSSCVVLSLCATSRRTRRSSHQLWPRARTRFAQGAATCPSQGTWPDSPFWGNADRLCYANGSGASARAEVADHQRQMRGFRAMRDSRRVRCDARGAIETGLKARHRLRPARAPQRPRRRGPWSRSRDPRSHAAAARDHVRRWRSWSGLCPWIRRDWPD